MFNCLFNLVACGLYFVFFLAACGLLLQFFCFLRFLWICLVIFYYLLLTAWFLFLSLLFIFLHLYFLVSPSIIPFMRLHLNSLNACSSSYLWKFFFLHDLLVSFLNPCAFFIWLFLFFWLEVLFLLLLLSGWWSCLFPLLLMFGILGSEIRKPTHR